MTDWPPSTPPVDVAGCLERAKRLHRDDVAGWSEVERTVNAYLWGLEPAARELAGCALKEILDPGPRTRRRRGTQ